MQELSFPERPVYENFRVDGWLVQPSLNQISRNGTSVRMEPKVMQVLVCLARQVGEPVSKESLLQEVWPDTFVTDDVLKRSISELRRALQDDARDPRIIQTISKRGYRLVVPRDPLHLDKELPAQPSTPPKRRARTWYFVTAGTVTVLVLAVVAIWISVRSPLQIQTLSVTQLTNDGQVKYDPLGTDGTRIYSSEYWAGQRPMLVQVPLNGGQPVAINTALRSPRFFDVSPDGTELLVGNLENLGRFSLWVMSVTGRVTRQIGELQADDYAAWTPDGNHVVYSNGRNVLVVGEDGQPPKSLFTAPGQVSFISMSPDAQVFRFTVRDMATKAEALWEASAQGENIRPLLADWSGHLSACCGRWTRDGLYYVFQAKRNGRNDLWALATPRLFLWNKNVEPLQLTGGPLEYSRPLPGKNVASLFAVGTLRRAEIVRYDMRSGQFVPYLFGMSAESASFSQDGNWVAYISYPDGILWRSRIDGSDQLQLTFPQMRALGPRWSPDAKKIAFMAQDPGQPWNIYVVPAEGGLSERVLPEGQSQAAPSWMPDGKSLVFGAEGNDSDLPLRILHLDSKQALPVPESSGLFAPQASPATGQLLAITKRRPFRLMLFDSGKGTWEQLEDYETSYPNWSHDEKYVYFSDWHIGHGRIARIRLSDRRIETAADLEKMGRVPVGTFGWWGGLAPDDSPLLSRDISTQEIYAIKWQLH